MTHKQLESKAIALTDYIWKKVQGGGSKSDVVDLLRREFMAFYSGTKSHEADRIRKFLLEKGIEIPKQNGLEVAHSNRAKRKLENAVL